ncbi:hypothetical protein COEREDRAFT_82680, partial [Coemansia reversa NRRL 1564]
FSLRLNGSTLSFPLCAFSPAAEQMQQTPPCCISFLFGCNGVGTALHQCMAVIDNSNVVAVT